MASQLVFLQTYLGREDSELTQQCAAAIIHQQGSHGGWSVIPNGPPDVSASVQAYFALKLSGYDPSDERLARARAKIRELGGADATDHTTRFFLALLGQVTYDDCPLVLPEAVLLSRQIGRLQVPWSIVWSHRPVRAVGIERGIRELFANKPSRWGDHASSAKRPTGWRRFMGSVLRRGCQFIERRGWTPLRRHALHHAELRLLEQNEPSRFSDLDFHELVWHIIALHTLGYGADSLPMRACEERLHKMVEVDEEEGIASPRLRTNVRGDTWLALRSLLGSGMSPSHPAIARAIDEVRQSLANVVSRRTLDLSNRLAGLDRHQDAPIDDHMALPPDFDICFDWEWPAEEPGQTAPETNDANDRAMVACIEALLKRQQSDGGWCEMPDLRRRAPQSQPDVTGAVLEVLAAIPCASVRLAVSHAADYLRSQQQADGSWATSDGSQQILCTSAAIRGLLAAGALADDDAVAAGANWLIVQQPPTGGWNESPTETAWAVLALVAVGMAGHPAARRGIDHLLDFQEDDGGWLEHRFVQHDPIANRWFRNDLHGVAWPLLALSEWAVAASSTQPAAANQLSLRLVAATAEI